MTSARVRKCHAVGELLEKLDFVSTAIGGGNLTSHLNNFTRLDGIDPAGAKLARQHRENTRPRSDFHNDGSFANGFAQRLSISIHANAIRDHRAIAAQAIHRISRASRSRFAEWVTITRLASAAMASQRLKTAEGSAGGAHAANGDSSHYPAEHVKFSGTHVAVEEIVHIGVGDELCEGVASGNFFYDRSAPRPPRVRRGGRLPPGATAL